MPSEAKILLVDDHEDTLYALESALAPLGYHLTRATSGEAALKEVLRGQVGLLLLDVRMPGVSGLDVVRYMRGVEQTQHIPVILLTGFGLDAELTAAAFRLGVADLVMKPIDPWSLRTKVRYLFDAHERAHALEREVRELRARLKDREDRDDRGARGHGHTGGRVVPAQRERTDDDALDDALDDVKGDVKGDVGDARDDARHDARDGANDRA
ncbi:response regulator [Streptomyces heilongjiangensis]|uniref:Two-component system response regulator n=1 Tax=Streptomyces heilongjiangensis TaxID=945052 RepID=A0ABW1B1J2_9ACTN|nr:response regulator [Streptomyces heilongjiangensis]MDC2949877.1 response regulator [Streptomyces heilongjiangensis]